MTFQALVVGGGIAGLAAAGAAVRAGWMARLYERAPQFSEAGAGLQLGPNATRRLIAWGLGDALDRLAARPSHLRVRSALDGRELAALSFGDFSARDGAPYLTLHRADLQQMLLGSAREQGVELRPATPVDEVRVDADAVRLARWPKPEIEGDALIGADGLWSSVRAAVIADGPPRFTGHVAFRALARQADLPTHLRRADVEVWLAPRLHVVAYPVQAGERLNVVVLAEGAKHANDPRNWDQAATAVQLRAATGPLCGPLQELVNALPAWRSWSLHDRAPVRGADGMSLGRLALAGDAAHPMLPYFAQGVGMAIEDAQSLEKAFHAVREGVADVPTALRRYALDRWQRVARVQALSRRNAWVFHAAGPLRWGRDLSLRVASQRLLDQPWLYGG
jgi:salicylate hydroxylase